MKKYAFLGAAALCAALATPAAAAPGLGGKVYGARIEKGVTEVEMRYGRLSGDAADGEDAAVLELSHGFTDNFLAGVLVETEREPHESRKVEAYSIETIGHIGRVDSLGLDIALYGEYEAVRHGADEIEAKLLLQHTKGPFDARLNLKFGKELEKGEPVELGYAVSADWAAFGEFRFGAEAFGNLGTTKDFLPRDEHFAGPMVRTELEHLPGNGELEIEAGYLFALGKSRDETNGQLRLVLEYEFHF
jgi:hypothetical protein